jgi:lantibiotic modifying enzyme
MIDDGDRALAQVSLAESTTPLAGLHEARLSAAIVACRDALSHVPLDVPPSVLRSLVRGLVQRLGFFTRAAPSSDAALFDRVVRQWLENVRVMWQRLHDDQAALEHEFGLKLVSIHDVRTNLGDPHGGGHTVSCIELSDGSSLVYKPRPVHLERFFSEVLEWMSTAELTFEGLDVLDRESYGWVRGVRARACASTDAVRRFHERLGGLLAIAYTFGATDLHEENVVANGEHPVLVDLETLVTPIVSQFEGDDRLRYSVFDVGLLPSFLAEGPNGEPRLSGGIGGGLTDASPSSNVPRLRDEPVAPFAYEAEVLRGFRRSWRRLCDRKSELVDLCESIKGATYRFVLRPTHEYWRALGHALETADLVDARAFRLTLAHALPLRPDLPIEAGRAALAYELATLTALDIPAFTGTVASRAIRAAGDTSSLFELAESPWQTLVDRVSRMAHEDDHRHLSRIAAAFATADPDTGTNTDTGAGSHPGAGTGVRQAANRDHHEARAIAAHLENASVETREGGLDWLEPRRIERHWQLGRVELGLASGRAGIGVFFAAMARCTGESRYRDVALRSFAWQTSSRRALLCQDPRPHLASGGGSGVASLVYALTLASQLLEDASLLDEALAWAALLTEGAGGDDVGVIRGDDDEHAWQLGFCRGASGRDLRLAASGKRLDAQPAWTQGHLEAPFDHLCCGNAGLVDMTLELGRRLNDPAYVDRSRALAASLMARASAPAAYRVPIGRNCQRPGLFDGLAGIGYMWLRQVDPQLPCVLLWETLGGR